MSYLSIHKALTQSLIDLSLGYPIAHENKDFDPDNLDSFIKINILYSEQFTVTKTKLDDVNGFMQVSLFTKSGSSVRETYNLVDALNTAYPHGSTFTAGDQVANIQNISINKRGNIDGWYTTDFTINFWADLTRP